MNRNRFNLLPQQNHPRERRLFTFASGFVLVASLILAPSSSWFAQAADEATIIPTWHLNGNKDTNSSTDFLGTTDNQALVLRTNNMEALRVLAGSGSTGGDVGIGTSSPAFRLDVHGDVNTSTKYDLRATTVLQTPGTQNTFVGPLAGLTNTTGGYNTATGAGALQKNTAGSSNTATGAFALANNIGTVSTGADNTATGQNAMLNNTFGFGNTASGVQSLNGNTTGDVNTADGFDALYYNTTGSNNTAIGWGAGVTSNNANANTTGSTNTFLGYDSGPGTSSQLFNATAVGANATVSASNALILGGTGVSAVNVGIGTQTPQSTLQVAGNGTSYGNYLQIPMVSSAAGPPSTDCNKTAFAGRMVLQDNVGAITLWVCSATSGIWVAR